MNIKQIKYFLEIAECKSFSKASGRVNIAQPALSSQIKALEVELGVTLLERHSRGVELTDMGYVVRNHFREIVRDIDGTKQLINNYINDPSGDVNIGITTTAARALVTTLVENSKERYPKISLHLFEAMSGTLNEQLSKGALDMAILYNYGRYDKADDLIDTPVAYENLYLIGSSNKDRVFGSSIDFNEIKGLPLAIPSHPHTLNTILSEMSLKTGVEINMAAEVNSFTGMIELSKAGYYTVSPIVSIKKEIERGELYAVCINNPSLYWTIHLVSTKDGWKSHHISAIHNLIVDIITQLVETGEWEANLV